MPSYNEEQINEARNTDIIDFMGRTNGFTFKKNGNEYRCIQHDSLVVRADRKGFFWNSKGIGGANAIDFCVKILNKSFLQALESIIGSGVTFSRENKNVLQVAQTAKRNFSLPEKAESNNRVIAYLTQSRGIDYYIIADMLKKGLIFQDNRGNAVFVGKDENGNEKYAFKRGTMTYGDKTFRGEHSDSDKSYAFKMTGKNTDTVYVFESAIDALSHATTTKIYKGTEVASQPTRISLGGLTDVALEKFLSQNKVKDLVFCLDNDEKGREATKKLTEKYAGKGYNIRVVTPKNKDFNEDLKALRKWQEEQAPQKQTSKKVALMQS